MTKYYPITKQCERCGQTFTWTAAQQMKRASDVKCGRLPEETPLICKNTCSGHVSPFIATQRALGREVRR